MKLDLDQKSIKALLIFGAVVEARDTYTGGHLWRVAQFSRLLGEKAGLSAADIFVVTIGGYLHDIGKVGVPDAILLKPGKLDQKEFEIVKTHPTIGKEIMQEHPLAPITLDAIAHHHERCDGTGYPDGLNCEETSIFSRIVSITDAFDAMTSTRSYRKGMPIEKAMSILKEFRDVQFDGKLVDLFLDIAKSDALLHIVGHSSFDRPLMNCPICGPVITMPKEVKDGDRIFCNVCTGGFDMHKKGGTFELNFSGNFATPDQVLPKVDVSPIEETLGNVPSQIEIPGYDYISSVRTYNTQQEIYNGNDTSH